MKIFTKISKITKPPKVFITSRAFFRKQYEMLYHHCKGTVLMQAKYE